MTTMRIVKCLAALAAFGFASPAMAVDAGPYVGIEGGLSLPDDLQGSARVEALNVGFICLPGATQCQFVPENFDAGDVVSSRLKRGMEADAIAGYDFGQFRVEAELGWKRTNREGLQIDPAFLDFLSVALHRPSSVVWDPGAPGMQALTQSDFASLDGKVSTKSAMINVLADFETPSAVEIYAGAGLGRAWARALNDSDSAWAGQLIAGVRTSVRPNVKMGLKYRYFRTATVKFEGGPLHIPGNPYTNFIGDIMFVQQDTADVIPRLNGRLQSHSLLVSLTFDLGKNGPD